MRAGAMKKLLALVLTASMAVSPLSASAAEVLHEDGKEVSLYRDTLDPALCLLNSYWTFKAL